MVEICRGNTKILHIDICYKKDEGVTKEAWGHMKMKRIEIPHPERVSLEKIEDLLNQARFNMLKK